MNELLLELADDELILGWRESEWTGIAPALEEDVAFSSIAQNEIGHARAAYALLTEIAPASLRRDPDTLAFDRTPEEYRAAPLVQLRLLEWPEAIARRWLYEQADQLRIEHLMRSEDPAVARLAAKIDREEAYHRMHAELWAGRLGADAQFRAAVERLWRYALGVVPDELRKELSNRVGIGEVVAVERGETTDDLRELWAEMTSVRRSIPGAQW